MSTTTVLGEFRRGEDIALALDAVSGDVGVVTASAAKMRQMRRVGSAFDFVDDAAAIDMQVVDREASGDISAGWTVSLGAAACAALEIGFYGVDVRLTIGSGVEITNQTAVIQISEAAL